MAKVVGLELATHVEQRSRRSYSALLAAGLLACLFVLAACVPQQQYQRRPVREPPPPRAPVQPALLSIQGDEPGLKVTEVDGVPWENLPESSILRDVNAPIGKLGAVGIWLAPGMHTVHAKFVRNIEGGISFVQGEIRVRAISGHTYMIHPTTTTDRGRVSFGTVDYGVSFLPQCLPGAISNAKQKNVTNRQVRFVHDDIAACMEAVWKY